MGMGRGRRLAAGASLLASAGGFAWIALANGQPFVQWHALAFGAGLAAASVGLTRKNLFVQALSRGLAWVLFAPCAVATMVELMRGQFVETAIFGFGLSSGLALLLARPMQNTDEARAAFAPSKFRRSFLAASTASVTMGLVIGMVAWETLWYHQLLSGLGLAALGTSMIASAFGVLRMRGWGIALATLNAIVSLVAGAFVGNGEGFAVAATALPGVLFLLPIVLAKLGFGERGEGAGASATRIRIAEAEEIVLPARLRIATDDEASREREDDVEEPRKAERALVA